MTSFLEIRRNVFQTAFSGYFELDLRNILSVYKLLPLHIVTLGKLVLFNQGIF